MVSQPCQTADFRDTLHRGSGRHFAAAASAVPQQQSLPANTQVSSSHPCSWACWKPPLLAVCLSELITPAPSSFPCRLGPPRDLEVQGHSHGDSKTQPLKGELVSCCLAVSVFSFSSSAFSRCFATQPRQWAYEECLPRADILQSHLTALKAAVWCCVRLELFLQNRVFSIHPGAGWVCSVDLHCSQHLGPHGFQGSGMVQINCHLGSMPQTEMDRKFQLFGA